MVSVNKIETGIVKYIDNEIMPHFPQTGWQRVAVGVCVGLLIKKYDNIVKYAMENPFMKTMGVFNDNGEVDIETLYELTKKNISEEGMSINIPVPSLGGLFQKNNDAYTLTFKKEDVDVLYKYIKEDL